MLIPNQFAQKLQTVHQLAYTDEKLRTIPRFYIDTFCYRNFFAITYINGFKIRIAFCVFVPILRFQQHKSISTSCNLWSKRMENLFFRNISKNLVLRNASIYRSALLVFSKRFKIVIPNKIHHEYFSQKRYMTWLNEFSYSELSNTIQVRVY